jgi:serine protease Do
MRWDARSLLPLLVLSALGACNRAGGAPTGGPVAPPATTAARTAAPGVSPKLEPTAEAQALSNAFAGAAKAIRSSVVRIDVEGIPPEALGEHALPPDMPEFLRKFLEQEAPPQKELRGTGSGVIVDGAGDVLTNGHVVRHARKVTLELADQRKFAARVVGTDPLTDLGVVRFEKLPPDLVAARLGNSDHLRIGEWAIAVGSPLGMDQTVTVGIISGVGATGGHFHFESGERVRKYIQTDAKINPGNSGGPLLNLEGEVIGINTLINVGPGGSYGFAIPINQAWQVAGALIKEGRVRYPYIGLSVTSLSEVPANAPERIGTLLPAEGALVRGVAPGGPADGAGIEPGDVITKIGGRPVKTGGDVVASISDQRIGGAVSVDYSRDGRTHATVVKVVEYPAEPRDIEVGARPLGLALQTLTEPLASSLGLAAKTTGALITGVTPGSPAQKAGLAEGDVIREIDAKPVASADDALGLLGASGARLMRITTAAGTRVVTVSPE